jgi:transposase
MIKEVDFTETQRYLQHFTDHGCDAEIVNHAEGIFNLFWLNVNIIDQLKIELEKKTVNIVRLKELISGMNTTSYSKTNDDDQSDKKDEPPTAAEASPITRKASDEKRNDKPKGHGRLGANDYPGAETVFCQHSDFQEGDTCPLCHRGILHKKLPKVKIQIDGNAPLTAKRYELEQFSCSWCDFSATAQAPVDLSVKYTARAVAILIYLHYGMGLPYYRLAKMQKMIGIPIAVSTQSELVESKMGSMHAIFNCLMKAAAQRDLLYQDDTGVRIQSLIKENKEGSPMRKGMFTSGFIAEGEHTIVLYFSGRAHAGENFDTILSQRDLDKGQVKRMADALSANSKHDADAIELKCSAHAFRRFRSLLSTYPEAALFVLGIYGQVYENDRICKSGKMSDQARLEYHQEHSGPLMDELETWFTTVLSDNEAEPNGVLAAECQYLSNHWFGLTQFLRIKGAPLDNNALESILKYMITYRKNSQSFKTAYSANYGSRLISIIITCMVNHINAVDYITQLQLHEQAVWGNPEAWMPWQYQQTLSEIEMLKSQAA